MLKISKKSVGIDISDRTIEIAELGFGDGEVKVLNLGRTFLPEGVVYKGGIKNKAELEAYVKKAMSLAVPRPIRTETVVFGLPDEKTYIHIFEIDLSKKRNLEAEVKSEIEKSIPIAKSNMVYEYRIAREYQREGAGKCLILSVTTKKSSLMEWENFFRGMGMNVKFFDIESLAAYRAIFKEGSGETAALLDIGAEKTIFSVFKAEHLVFNYYFDLGGIMISQKIKESLKINFKEAEKVKKNEGLNNNIVKEVLEEFLADFKNSIEYYEKKNGEKIENFFLLGGSSKLLGLEPYLSEVTGKKVIIASSIFSKNNIRFIGSEGLALAGIDEKWQERDPLISPFFEKKVVSEKVFTNIKVDFHLFDIPGYVKEKKKFLSFVFIMLLLIAYFGVDVYKKKDSKSSVADQERIKIEQNLQNLKEKLEKIETTKVVEEVKEFVKIKNLGYSINIRSGPGTGYNIVGQATPGEEFALKKRGEEWTEIELKNGELAWVFNDLIE